MKHPRLVKPLIALALLAAAWLFTANIARAAEVNLRVGQVVAPADLSANATVFASGLNNPRGLKFGPDGNLYVAEGGTGGKNSTVGKCDQVPAPVGPYTGSKTGSRISKISPDGKVTTVADNLPSSQTTAATGGFVSGVGDIAFVGNTLYAVLAGAGCSHGVPDVPNGLVKVNGDGTTTPIADLGAFLKANPVKHPNASDFEPDGTWYGMLSANGALYAVEPNRGELDKITTDGKVSRVVDISDSQGHIVPTAIALGSDGNFYVGNLSEFPAAATAKILKITPGGQLGVYAQGLTAVLGVAFDAQGRLYALEASAPVTKQGPPVLPGTGRVVRIKTDGSLEPVATGLTFPAGMTFGPDGKLYVSNNGFGLPPGKGEIVRIDTSVALPTTAPTTGGSYDPLATVWLAFLVGVLLVAVGWITYKRSARS